jgi:hypothetical protein
MGSRRGGRPSPALVVSVLALVVAVSGTAVAATALTKSQKKQVRNIAANQVSQLAPDLSVAKAKSADSATSASSATSANSATTADSAAKANSATTAESANTANTAASAANAGALQGTNLAAVAPGEFGFQLNCVLTGLLQTCGSVTLTVNRAADVMVVVTTQWFSPDAAGTSVRAHCDVRRGVFSSSNVSMGTTSDDTDSNQPRTFAMTHQFADVPAGTETYELRCAEDSGDVALVETRIVGFVVTS